MQVNTPGFLQLAISKADGKDEIFAVGHLKKWLKKAPQ